jgi:hypothetical protein
VTYLYHVACCGFVNEQRTSLENVLASKIVERDVVDTKALDKGLKNAWKWEWSERQVNEEPVRRFIRKFDARGLARCELCNRDISYGGRGWRSIEQHISKKLQR